MLMEAIERDHNAMSTAAAAAVIERAAERKDEFGRDAGLEGCSQSRLSQPSQSQISQLSELNTECLTQTCIDQLVKMWHGF